MIKALIFLLIIITIFVSYFFIKKIKTNNVLLSVLVISIIMLIFLSIMVLRDEIDKELIYFPPKYDGEKIIPGHFYEKN